MVSEYGRKAEGSRTVPNLIHFVFGMACTISLQAADPTGIASLPDYERRGIEKLAELTAKDHSTILFTIADETIGFAKDGAVGRNFLNDEPLGGKTEGEMRHGDTLRIETPGGGGIG